MSRTKRDYRRFPTLKTLSASVLAATLLSACGGSNVKPVTDADIANAQRGDRLAALYTDIKTQLSKAPNDKVLQTSLTKVAQAYAKSQQAEIEYILNSVRNGKGLVPASADAQVQPMVEALKSIDSNTYDTVKQLVDSERGTRESRIAQLSTLLADTPAANVDERVAISEEILELNGLKNDHDARMSSIISDARDLSSALKEQGQFDEAANLLLVVSKYDSSADLQNELQAANLQAQLGDLESLKQAGDVDGLYIAVSELAVQTNDAQFLQELSPFATELVQYYSLMAQTAQGENDLPKVYENLSKISQLKNSIPDIDAGGMDQLAISDFVSQIYLTAEDAFAAQQLGMALAYLAILEDFGDLSESQTQTRNKVESKLYEQGVVKLAASQFDSPENAPGLGSLITASIVEQFVNEGRKDIRILERDSIDSVLKEQEIKALKGGGEINISTADFLVQGAVLEANVDESSQALQKTKRVVTDRKEVPNPAYQAWLQLSEDARKRTLQPTQTKLEDVKENIRYQVTSERKLGSVTASFRIINPANAKLLHAETVQGEREFAGESIEGLEIGLYQQDAVSADLPASSSILRDLADEIAQQISSKLVAELQNPEARYLAQGSELEEAGKYSLAADALGKAIMMLQAKTEPTDQPMAHLKAIALKAQ